MSWDTHFISTLSESLPLAVSTSTKWGTHAFPLQRPAESSHLTNWQWPCSLGEPGLYFCEAGPYWLHMVPPPSPSPFNPPVPFGPVFCPLQSCPIHHLVNPHPHPPRASLTITSERREPARLWLAPALIQWDSKSLYWDSTTSFSSPPPHTLPTQDPSVASAGRPRGQLTPGWLSGGQEGVTVAHYRSFLVNSTSVLLPSSGTLIPAAGRSFPTSCVTSGLSCFPSPSKHHSHLTSNLPVHEWFWLAHFSPPPSLLPSFFPSHLPFHSLSHSFLFSFLPSSLPPLFFSFPSPLFSPFFFYVSLPGTVCKRQRLRQAGQQN